MPTDVQTALYLEGRRLLDRSTRWVLQGRQVEHRRRAEIEHFQAGLDALLPLVPEFLVGAEQGRLRAGWPSSSTAACPTDLALRAAGLLDAFSLLDVVEIAAAEKRPADEVAAIYFALSERFEVDQMLTRITELPRDDRWSALARSALRYDLYAALAGLTTNVLSVDAVERARTRCASRRGRSQPRGRRPRPEHPRGDRRPRDNFDLATLSVALRTIRTLVR